METIAYRGSDAEQEAEQQEIKANVASVFEHHMQGKLAGVTDIQKPRIISRFLPSLFDALKRGKDPVFHKLRTGEFSSKLPQVYGIRKYRIIDDTRVEWTVQPDSEDPFQSLEFDDLFSKTGLPTQGVIHPLADPFIVDAMIRDGLSQQGSLHNRFLNTFQHISQIVESDKGTAGGGSAALKYLYSPISTMARYLEVYNRLMGHPSGNGKYTGSVNNTKVEVTDMTEAFAKEFSKARPIPNSQQEAHREAFIQEVLVGDNTSILEDLPTIQEQCTEIHKLIELFVGPKGVVPNNSRDGYEYALATELLINPTRFVGHVGRLQIPRTNAKNIYAVGQLLERAVNTCQNKEPVYIAEFIKKAVSPSITDTLTPLFTELGIDTSLGLEYIDGLLTRAIQGFIHMRLPGITPSQIQQRKELNTYFSLSERIGGKKTEPGTNRLQGILSSVGKNDFLRGELLLGLSDEEAQTLLEGIFSSDGLSDQVLFERSLKHLMSYLRTMYNPKMNGFVITPARKLQDRQARTILAQQYYRFVAEKVTQGDKRMIDFFEKRVLKQFVKDFFTQEDFPFTAEEFIEQTRSEYKNPAYVSIEDKLKAQQAVVAARSIGIYLKDEDYRLPTLGQIIRETSEDSRVITSLFWPRQKDTFVRGTKEFTHGFLGMLRRKVFGGDSLEDRQRFLADKLTNLQVSPYVTDRDTHVSFHTI